MSCNYILAFVVFVTISGARSADPNDLTDGEGGFGYGLPFNCPLTFPSKLNLQLPGILPVRALPCAQDCISNHGAVTGNCDGLGNCICNYTTNAATNPGETIPIAYSSQLCTGQACQCADITASEFFGNICDADCACNHGANYGTCDYEKRVCKCNYNQAYNSSTCVMRQLNNPEQYPVTYQKLYGIYQQSASVKFIYNALMKAASNPQCVPSLFPLTNLYTLVG